MVGESYWISPITKRGLASILEYPFRPGGGRIIACSIALFLVLSYLALVVGAIRRSIRRRDRDETDALLFCVNGAVNWGGTVLLGIAASLIFRPVFVSRYMVPALGSLWLGYAVLLGRLEGRARYLRLAAAAVLLCAALLNVRSFIAAELRMKNAFEKLEARLETIEEDARFVASDTHMSGTIPVLTGKDCYLWNQKPLQSVYSDMRHVYETAEIRNWLLDGQPVYFVERLPSAKPSAAEAFDGSGIAYSDLGAYALERYSLKIYRLEAA